MQGLPPTPPANPTPSHPHPTPPDTHAHTPSPLCLTTQVGSENDDGPVSGYYGTGLSPARNHFQLNPDWELTSDAVAGDVCVVLPFGSGVKSVSHT